MDTKRNPLVASTFGTWLQTKMHEFGMSRSDAAEKLGVTKMTIGRWINGRIPEASYLERIADVFLVDYDFVATKAGYRPRELMLEVDPASPEGQLVPLIRKIQWTDRDLVGIRAQLEYLARQQSTGERDE